MSNSNTNYLKDSQGSIGPIHICSCIIRKAKSLNLRVYLLSVVLLSVILVVFMSTDLNHNKDADSSPSNYVLLNDTEYQPFVNITETKEPSNTEPGLLLLLIHASGKEIGKARRDAIRSTWLSEIDIIADELGRDISYKFVLGGFNVSTTVMQNLTIENKIYQDMIFLADVPDSHDTLTLRTLRGFEYFVTNSMNYQYVLKCDDDTFINLKVIANELKEINGEGRIYWGEFQGACNVIMEGPYAEFNWHQCESYVPYAYGGGYILSKDLVELLALNAPYLKIYSNEDVSVGAWLAPYSLRNRHDARFNTGSNSRGCKRQFIISHKISAEMMYSYFASLSRDGYFCSRRNRWYGWRGHTYNWKRVPSRCCRHSRRIP